jgi:hypothetical protein
MADRLDRIMHGLEVLQNDADRIIDAHINVWLAEHPEAVSWGEAKLRLVALPAGTTINRVAALKILRRGLTGKD